MDPREEIHTLQGEAQTSARPLTPEERRQLEDRAKAGARLALWGRLGCAAAPLLFIGSLVALGSVPKESGAAIVSVMVVSFVGLAWLLLSARDARERAKLAERELQSRAVERYVIGGKEVEALEATGRILRRGNERPESEYGVRRVVGLPHALVQNDRTEGPRRLSAAEIEEIDRLIALSRKKLDFLEVFTYLFATVMTLSLLLVVPSSGWNISAVVMPTLSYVALASTIWQRWSHARIRQAFREGKSLGTVMGQIHGEKHFEVLAGRIVWTIDGQPAPIRTRWLP